MTDLTHLGIDDYESVEEIANAVKDDLTEHVRLYPGSASSAYSVGAAAYDVVMRAFGHDEEED